MERVVVMGRSSVLYNRCVLQGVKGASWECDLLASKRKRLSRADAADVFSFLRQSFRQAWYVRFSVPRYRTSAC